MCGDYRGRVVTPHVNRAGLGLSTSVTKAYTFKATYFRMELIHVFSRSGMRYVRTQGQSQTLDLDGSNCGYCSTVNPRIHNVTQGLNLAKSNVTLP